MELVQKRQVAANLRRSRGKRVLSLVQRIKLHQLPQTQREHLLLIKQQQETQRLLRSLRNQRVRLPLRGLSHTPSSHQVFQ